MLIIGITGTIGAGKGTVVDYLIKNYNFQHYSVRSFLIGEITKRGLLVNRDSMTMIANELRENNHPAYIVEQLYFQAIKESDRAIIESIRTCGEIELLKAKSNFYLMAVDADVKTRYQRITIRNSETDHISFETFLSNEQREMHSTDPNKQNLSKCISVADFVIDNSSSLENLYNQVDEIMHKILLLHSNNI